VAEAPEEREPVASRDEVALAEGGLAGGLEEGPIRDAIAVDVGVAALLGDVAEVLVREVAPDVDPVARRAIAEARRGAARSRLADVLEVEGIRASDEPDEVAEAAREEGDVAPQHAEALALVPRVEREVRVVAPLGAERKVVEREHAVAEVLVALGEARRPLVRGLERDVARELEPEGVAEAEGVLIDVVG